ncbi:unnamed protein product [Fusarium langsethiae]|nr:unnamed protein product [Fusarium langsethiae]
MTQKRAETVQDDDIYIWATTNEGLQDPEILNDPIIDPQDKRRYATNKDHKNLSWVSCTVHHCALHLSEKDCNDCFPRLLKVYEHQKPYLIIDTVGCQVQKKYPEAQVVRLRAHPETRERALIYFQNRLPVEQRRQHLEPQETENVWDKTQEDEQLVAQWRRDTQDDSMRRDTPDPDTLRWERWCEDEADRQEKEYQYYEMTKND